MALVLNRDQPLAPFGLGDPQTRDAIAAQVPDPCRFLFGPPNTHAEPVNQDTGPNSYGRFGMRYTLKQNNEYLGNTVIELALRVNDFIQQILPIRMVEGESVRTTTLRFDGQAMAYAPELSLPSLLTFEQSTKTTHLERRSQGFRMSSELIRTQEGMMLYGIQIKSIANKVYATMHNQAIFGMIAAALQNGYETACRQERSIVNNPASVFAYDKMCMGMTTSSENFFAEIAMMGKDMLRRHQHVPDAILYPEGMEKIVSTGDSAQWSAHLAGDKASLDTRTRGLTGGYSGKPGHGHYAGHDTFEVASLSGRGEERTSLLQRTRIIGDSVVLPALQVGHHGLVTPGQVQIADADTEGWVTLNFMDVCDQASVHHLGIQDDPGFLGMLYNARTPDEGGANNDGVGGDGGANQFVDVDDDEDLIDPRAEGLNARSAFTPSKAASPKGTAAVISRALDIGLRTTYPDKDPRSARDAVSSWAAQLSSEMQYSDKRAHKEHRAALEEVTTKALQSQQVLSDPVFLSVCAAAKGNAAKEQAAAQDLHDAYLCPDSTGAMAGLIAGSAQVAVSRARVSPSGPGLGVLDAQNPNENAPETDTDAAFRTFWEQWANCPFDLLLARPFRQYDTAHVLQCAKGPKLGFTAMHEPDFQVSSNNTQRVIEGNTVFRSACVITNPNAVKLWPDVHVLAYRGGEGTAVFNWAQDLADFQNDPFSAMRENASSILAIPIPMCTDYVNRTIDLPSTLSMTGKLGDHMTHDIPDLNGHNNLDIDEGFAKRSHRHMSKLVDAMHADTDDRIERSVNTAYGITKDVRYTHRSEQGILAKLNEHHFKMNTHEQEVPHAIVESDAFNTIVSQTSQRLYNPASGEWQIATKCHSYFGPSGGTPEALMARTGRSRRTHREATVF